MADGEVASAHEEPIHEERAPSRRARARRVTIVLCVFTAAVALALVARSMRPRSPLPVYGQVPIFHLLDERGAPFATDSMLGRVSVVDFVFTRCSSSCPRLTARMRELQERFVRDRSDVRLVSFSVDPDNDTPPVLADYAEKARADLARWTFVTGAVDDIARAVVLGFKISAEKVTRGAEDYDVTHGDWFVLVDRNGALRGYYTVQAERDFEALVADAKRLEHQSR